jgi:glycosyltransferase involved in cell wall biosynthesis
VRVVHVAPTSFGAGGLFGGGERYPLELARAVATLPDVECELVTFGRKPTAMLDRVQPRLRVRTVRPWCHLHGHPAHPLSPAALTALAGADIVHTHQMHSTSSRITAVLATVQRRPVVVTDHGLTGGDWAGLLPRLFDRLLAVSRCSAALLDFPPERTTIVYGGANTDHFCPDTTVSRDGVLFVGRLTPHKGIDRLLHALPDRATLTIAGTPGHDQQPPERDYPRLLRQLAAGRPVRFLSATDDDKLARLYRSAEVVALPTVDVTCYGRHIAIPELLGLAALEAMASGTPVVASRLGGLPEIVIDGETGWLVPPGDTDALQDRLAWTLAHRRQARQMGDNARQLAHERFSWTRCAQRCAAAYHEILR